MVIWLCKAVLITISNVYTEGINEKKKTLPFLTSMRVLLAYLD